MLRNLLPSIVHRLVLKNVAEQKKALEYDEADKKKN